MKNELKKVVNNGSPCSGCYYNKKGECINPKYIETTCKDKIYVVK